MSKAVSRGQALEVSARVATQINWDALDGDQLQNGVIQLAPEEFGRRFTLFLANNAQVNIGGLLLPIDRSKPFNPETFIGKGRTIWKGPADGDGLAGEEEQDAQSLALTTVDIGKVIFEHTLVDKETSVKGEEKLKRLITAKRIRLDAKIGQSLWEEPGKRTLEILRIQRGITWFDLPGTVLRNPGGGRDILCFDWDGGEWNWNYDWLGVGWDADCPSGVLASPLVVEARPS